ncbi:endonuclease domain-containing protein [Agromyces neolithicus]|uniref:Restriction endonuclease type II-like domain-containing protein n=1 Tax=Agromyces neolithicus TaxID=269420 RepID=A0ABN2M968_9MICO
MPDLVFDLRRLGGLATRTRLRAMGHSARGISAAEDSRRILRIGRSWLALPDANSEARRALALRGILGGESALRTYRIWVSHHTGTCIVSPPTASRLPLPRRGEYRLWRPHPPAPSTPWRVGVVDALAEHLPRIADPAHAVATLDSALNRRLLTPAELERLMDQMPRRIRRLRRHLDRRAESGLESLLRFAIRREGWTVESQVEIDGVGRVDLVIDGWLVIEADGSAWHEDHESIERDRERNSALVLRGFRWHRFGYPEVMNDVDGCIDVIRALLAGAPLQGVA